MEDGGIGVGMSWIFPQVSTTANPPPVKQQTSNTSPPFQVIAGRSHVTTLGHNRPQTQLKSWVYCFLAPHHSLHGVIERPPKLLQPPCTYPAAHDPPPSLPITIYNIAPKAEPQWLGFGLFAQNPPPHLVMLNIHPNHCNHHVPHSPWPPSIAPIVVGME